MLLKNDDRTLPLAKDAQQVYVAGSNADSIGDQAGGWTITWQGNSNHQIPGDTVLEGIEKTAKHDVTFSEDASAPVPPGAEGVVVVGETPYAEGFGDVGGPRWGYDPGENGVLRPAKTMQLSDADTQAIRTVCAQAASCTVLVVSGRPMVIPPELLGQIDALVASWLPGSEGARRRRRPLRPHRRSPASCRSPGRARWSRSRSTSVTRTTTRSTATGSASAPADPLPDSPKRSCAPTPSPGATFVWDYRAEAWC